MVKERASDASPISLRVAYLLVNDIRTLPFKRRRRHSRILRRPEFNGIQMVFTLYAMNGIVIFRFV